MKTIYLLLIALLFIGCADSKYFQISEKEYIKAEPYGWANHHSKKIDGVVYDICLGNVIWSVIGIETIIIPVWLTGWELYEPISYKPLKK